MDWHTRYLQQAHWTRDLRAYLFEKAGLAGAHRVLEAGCGTGAILHDLKTSATLHGLDQDAEALDQCGLHVPTAALVQGDALSLPYPDGAFDITCCHYLLLWVTDPLRVVREMARVTRGGGHVLALAEPDYSGRVDKPAALATLGHWQTEALQRQGADPSLGGRLAGLFFRAGIEIVETGPIAMSEGVLSPQERALEWAVLESDLAGFVDPEDLRAMRQLDEQAWARGERVLQVPTYFAWGRV